MAEGKVNPEVGKMRRVDLNKPKDPKRREVIKGLGLLGAAIVAPPVAKLLFGKHDESKNEPRIRVDLKSLPDKKAQMKAESRGHKIPFEMVFGDLADDQKKEAAEKVRTAKVWIHNNTSYRQMLSITRQYEGEIRQMAKQINFPEALALGIVFIENGGGTDKISDADARGIAQLMPETARQYGMQVDENWQSGGQDERSDPLKSIEVMGKFLKDQLRYFKDDLGFTLWSYHGGVGNIIEAIRIFVREKEGVNMPDLLEEKDDFKALEILAKYKDKAERYNVHRVVSNQAVYDELIAKLKDESDLYPYKVVAAAELFEEEPDG